MWTHSHTHSNQQSRERHLAPADIPPQDERRFYTAVTLSKHQEETDGDGRAGSEKTGWLMRRGGGMQRLPPQIKKKWEVTTLIILRALPYLWCSRGGKKKTWYTHMCCSRSREAIGLLAKTILGGFFSSGALQWTAITWMNKNLHGRTPICFNLPKIKILMSMHVGMLLSDTEMDTQICSAFWISSAKASVAGSKKHVQFQLHTKLANT